jgi:hypothetical protein
MGVVLFGGLYRHVQQFVFFADGKVIGLQPGKEITHDAQAHGSAQQFGAEIVLVHYIGHAAAQQQQYAAAHEAGAAVAVVEAFFFVLDAAYFVVVKAVAVAGRRVEHVHAQAGGHLHNDVFRYKEAVVVDIVDHCIVAAAAGGNKLDGAALEVGFHGFVVALFEHHKIGGLAHGRERKQQQNDGRHPFHGTKISKCGDW